MVKDITIDGFQGEAVVMGEDVIIKLPLGNVKAAEETLRLLTKRVVS